LLCRSSEPTIAKRVLQCCVLNGGIFWFSIAFFKYFVLPGLRMLNTFIMGSNNFESGVWLWSWLEPFLTGLFGLIWIVPLFVMSKIINSLWFQDIADYAYKFRKV
jgi:etoposide-induced 2.4 mRNA